MALKVEGRVRPVPFAQYAKERGLRNIYTVRNKSLWFNPRLKSMPTLWGLTLLVHIYWDFQVAHLLVQSISLFKVGSQSPVF